MHLQLWKGVVNEQPFKIYSPSRRRDRKNSSVALKKNPFNVSSCLLLRTKLLDENYGWYSKFSSFSSKTMLLEIFTGTSLLFYFLVGAESPRRKLIQYAAWVSSRQELVLLLFSLKGIRWYLGCNCQVREVSVTKFYDLKAVNTSCSFSTKVFTGTGESPYTSCSGFLVSAKDGQSVGSLPELLGRLVASSARSKKSRFGEHVTKSNSRS